MQQQRTRRKRVRLTLTYQKQTQLVRTRLSARRGQKLSPTLSTPRLRRVDFLRLVLR